MKEFERVRVEASIVNRGQANSMGVAYSKLKPLLESFVSRFGEYDQVLCVI